MTTYLPIIYIHGTFENTRWHGAWCRDLKIVNKETVYFPAGTTVIDFVQHNTPDRSGIIRAGVNGGLFDTKTLALVGHVGTGGNWSGYDIRRHRWGFGMHLQGSNFLIDRMTPTGTGLYTIPPAVRNYPYGLTGIGCLIRHGVPEPLNNQDNWPNGGNRDARALIAWDKRNFFLIVCRRGFEKGWTWEHTVEFLTQELPRYMQNTWKVRVQIQGAMMLDGGGSTQFLYRCAPIIGRGWEEGKYAAQDEPRRVPTIVHAWVTGLKSCNFPGHIH